MTIAIEINSADKSSILKSGSLNISKGADNVSYCSLSLVATASDLGSTDGLIIGQDLKVKDGATVIFGGIIKTVRITQIEPGAGNTKHLQIDISSNGYNDVAARRVTTLYYTAKTAGYIVGEIITNIFNLTGYDDNITAGTVSDGATISEYSAVCKSCKTILDELAETSGFKWYIDDSKALYFVAEDTVTDAAHDLVESGATFTDFKVLDVEISLENYRNKQWIVGGSDTDGEIIYTSAEDATEITARATAEGSSGVYGDIISVDKIQNTTDAAATAANGLKRYGIIPYIIRFTSMTNDWIAGTKLKVNLPSYGIASDMYFLIESVVIEDIGGLFQSTITATRRKAADFSTQRTEDYKDYFAKLAEKGESGYVYDDSGTAYKVEIYVQAAEPAGAKGKAVWIDTDDYSRYDLTAITSETTLNEDDDEVITCSGTFTLTLHAGTNEGVIKKIYNVGTGIITIAGTINGVVNMLLYPGESVEIITDGTNWRA